MKSFFEKNKLVILSLASGLMLFLSWPPFGLAFIAFVAFLPLLRVEMILLENKESNSSLNFFKLAYLAFLVFNLTTTWWIALSTLPGMLVAVTLNSFFMTIPWWLVHVWRRSSSKQGWLPLLFLWLSFEHLHSQWELAWSWLDLGNVFSTIPAFVQWYEYSGVAGGTLWILVVNLLAFSVLKEIFWLRKPHQTSLRNVFEVFKSDRLARKRTTLLFSFFILSMLLPIAFSLTTYWNYKENVMPLEVVIVQPSEDPYHQPNAFEQMAMTETMIELARSSITSQTAFVVSPEVAIPEPLWIHQTQVNNSLLRIQQFLTRNPQIHWVTGVSILELHKPGEKLPFTARQIPNTDKHYTIFNSAIITNHEELLDYYHKSKLVPGIEAIPYVSVLKPLGKVFSLFGGTAKGLGKQDSRTVFKLENGAVIAPVICFESIFGDYMTEYARLGANIVFIMTNDGWWGNTPGYRQHNQYARLRAIELRKPVVRAASTGISSFIDQRGNFLKQTNWNERIAIREKLNLNTELTYFARNGNVIGKTSLFFSALVLLAILVQVVLKRNDKLG